MKFRHIDTDEAKVTIVEDTDKERAEDYKRQLEDLRARGLVIDLGNGAEFGLIDYRTISDRDNKPIFHFKIKNQEGIVLYHLTDHPESRGHLDAVIIWARENGFVLRDARAEAEKMDKLVREGNESNTKEGVHPEMDYIGKDGELDLG